MNAVSYGITKAHMDEMRSLLAAGFNHDHIMNTLRLLYKRRRMVYPYGGLN